MTREDLEDLILTRFSDYDSSKDISEGSEFRSAFLNPLVDVLAVDDDTDTQNFLIDRFNQEYPDLAVRERGSVLSDILIKAPSIMLETLRRETRQLRAERAGFGDPTALTDESAGDLASSFFVSRVTAGYSTVPVRLYFSAPTRVVLFAENTARTAGGLRFVPALVTEITEEELQGNYVNNLYYADVLYVAESPGSDYTIQAGAIYVVDGVPGLVKAVNLQPSTPAEDDETAQDLADRVLETISERSMVTKRGILNVLSESIPGIFDTQAVGFGDTFMERDLLTASVVTSANVTEAVISGESIDPVLVNTGVKYLDFPYVNELSLYIAAGQVTAYDNADIDYITMDSRDRGVSQVNSDSSPYVYMVSDFAVVYLGTLSVSSYPVCDGGVSLINSPSADLGAATEGSISAIAAGQMMVRKPWGGLDLAWANLTIQYRSTAPDKVTVDCGSFAVHAHGEDTNHGTAVHSWGLVSLNVPGTFGWPGSRDHTYLTVERVGVGAHPTLPQWLEFNNVLMIVPSVAYSITTITVGPPSLGWADGGSGAPDPAPGTLVDGATYKWALWYAEDYDNLFKTMTRGSARVYASVIINLDEGLSSDDLLAYNADVGWSARTIVAAPTFSLSVSDVPGGILFPDPSTGATVDMDTDEVHIGGKVDVYLAPRSDFGSTVTEIAELRDIDPLLRGSDLTWAIGSSICSGAGMTPAVFGSGLVMSAAVSRWNGSIYESYRILRASTGFMQLDHVFTQSETSGVDYYMSSPYVTYDLKTPRVLKVTGSDLESFVAASYVDTGESLSTVEVGDLLTITTQSTNEGNYTITAVQDGRLVLDSMPPVSLENMEFEISSASSDFSKPIIRFTDVRMIDGGGSVTVPHGPPVGIVARTDFTFGMGLVRAYFKDRTLFFIPAGSILSVGEVSFCPLIRDDQYYDESGTAIPTGTPLGMAVMYTNAEDTDDDAVVTGTTLTTTTDLSAGMPFFRSGVIRFLYKTIYGSVAISTSSIGIAGLAISLRVGSGPARTLMFSGTGSDTSIPLTGANSVVSQINDYFPDVTASMDTTLGPNRLALRCASDLVVENGSSNAIFGISHGQDNTSENAPDPDPGGSDINRHEVGTIVWNGTTCTVTFSEAVATPESGVIYRLGWDWGAVSAFPAEMEQDPDTGLYYVDFYVWPLPTYLAIRANDEEGGDSVTVPVLFASPEMYNLEGGTSLTLTSYITSTVVGTEDLDPADTGTDEEYGYSDYFEGYGYWDQDLIGFDYTTIDTPLYFGYKLRTENSVLTMSTAEEIRLDVSAVFYDASAENALAQVYVTPSQTMRCTYEVCPVTDLAQSVMSDSDSRIMNADLLAKAGLPIWVLGNITYYNGEDESVVLPALRSYIRSRKFDGYLDISEVRGLIRRYGATDFDDPTTLFAVSLSTERVFSMMQFQDRLTPDAVHRVVPDPDLLQLTRS